METSGGGGSSEGAQAGAKRERGEVEEVLEGESLIFEGAEESEDEGLLPCPFSNPFSNSISQVYRSRSLDSIGATMPRTMNFI